jgi:DNA-binding MarR family transcriptional regulator
VAGADIPSSPESGACGVCDTDHIEDVEREFAMAIRSVGHVFEQYRAAFVRKVYGVGPSEGTVLGELRLSDALTPSELARRVGLTPAATTEVLDRLERAGHVERGPHPGDRRKVLVTITRDSRELIERATVAFTRVLAPALDGLDVPARERLVRLLFTTADILRAGTRELRS